MTEEQVKHRMASIMASVVASGCVMADHPIANYNLAFNEVSGTGQYVSPVDRDKLKLMVYKGIETDELNQFSGEELFWPDYGSLLINQEIDIANFLHLERRKVLALCLEPQPSEVLYHITGYVLGIWTEYQEDRHIDYYYLGLSPTKHELGKEKGMKCAKLGLKDILAIRTILDNDHSFDKKSMIEVYNSILQDANTVNTDKPGAARLQISTS